MCRKGFYALNCQAVSSPDLKFLDVVARWPGSTHDAAIFENSRLKDYLDNHDGMILLGDSGYALKRYLLTPIPAPRNEQEHLYNRQHRQGRLCIERTFHLLKSISDAFTRPVMFYHSSHKNVQAYSWLVVACTTSACKTVFQNYQNFIWRRTMISKWAHLTTTSVVRLCAINLYKYVD
ncbi:putative nuclease HARBI1 [Dreissena polymorpha]|uniref:putative nuclease HARBI1 n=1 Tax=Dreissena polymorpha TaxID=45954 RepID=UPI00226528A6|nr:putative nuclease HARBI1 [Dreissena polymorpha]